MWGEYEGRSHPGGATCNLVLALIVEAAQLELAEDCPAKGVELAPNEARDLFGLGNNEELIGCNGGTIIRSIYGSVVWHRTAFNGLIKN